MGSSIYSAFVRLDKDPFYKDI